jgi:outer membrane protein TolC
MRKLALQTVGLAIAMLAAPVHATIVDGEIAGPPEPAPIRCIALDEVLALALEQSPEVKLATADRLRADADLRAARSVTRPQVSTFLRTQAGDNNLTGSGLENSAGIRVSQRLFDFGIAGLERDAARLSLDARGYDVLTSENQAALEAALAFIGYAEISARLDVTKDRELFFEREQTAIALALKLGGATRSDLAEVSARLADASADRLELEFQRDRFATILARRTGEVAPPCAASLDALAATDDPSVVANVERALSENPQIQAANLELKAEEARAERARRNRLPAIELVGIVSFAQDNFDDNDFGLRERIGIDISIPLVSGGRLESERQRSQADILARTGDVQRLRLDLAESVEISARRIASLRQQLHRRRVVVEQQEKQFAAASAEFDEGLRTLPEWVEDRLQLEGTRLDEVTARFALLREVAELQAQTNTIRPDLSPTANPAYGPPLER